MRAFITGGSGFVGQRLVRRLVRDGYEVSALARSDTAAAALRTQGAQPVIGDLDDVPAWEDSLKGMDVVIHLAAPPQFWGPWRLFDEGIVQATRRVAEGAARAGAERFIFISSEAVVQTSVPLLGIDETYPTPPAPNSFRGKAKLLAEHALLAVPSPGMTRVILRPAYIWGRGNKGIENVRAKIASGRFRWIDQGRAAIETVHAENVVEAIALACTRGADGEVYFVTDDDPISFREHFTPILRLIGVEPPEKNLPGVAARPLAAVLEAAWRRLGIATAPPITTYDWYFASVPRRYRIDKIRRDLGYVPTFSREDGLNEYRAPAHGTGGATVPGSG